MGKKSNSFDNHFVTHQLITVIDTENHPWSVFGAAERWKLIGAQNPSHGVGNLVSSKMPFRQFR
jgi:hypothetical protein